MNKLDFTANYLLANDGGRLQITFARRISVRTLKELKYAVNSALEIIVDDENDSVEKWAGK